MWPSVLGGKNWTPMSWNPSTGLAYANTLNMSWPYQIAKQDYKRGEWYVGVNLRGVNFTKGQTHGYLSAIDPMTGKSKWQMAWPGQPSMAGTLSTAGGLVFTGAATGEFMAVDANTGKKLYEFNVGTGISFDGALKPGGTGEPKSASKPSCQLFLPECAGRRSGVHRRG